MSEHFPIPFLPGKVTAVLNLVFIMCFYTFSEYVGVRTLDIVLLPHV